MPAMTKYARYKTAVMRALGRATATVTAGTIGRRSERGGPGRLALRSACPGPLPRSVDLRRGDLGRALHFDDDALVELVVDIERDRLVRIVHVPEDQSIAGEERSGGYDAGEVRAEAQPVERAVRFRGTDCHRADMRKRHRELAS